MRRTALLVTPSLSSGGAERHVAYMAMHLDARSWRPLVLAFRGGPLEPELARADVPVRVLSGSGAGVLRHAIGVFRVMWRERPAVIAVHHIAADLPVRLALAAWWLLGRRRVPLIVWKHTYGHVGHRGARERAFERLTGRAVSAYGTVCHTQVTYLRQSLRLPSSRLEVVQNSVPAEPPVGARDTLTTALGPGAGRPVAIAVGALRSDKGHADLLEAWHAVLHAVPEASLVFVGDGPQRENLQEQARKMGHTSVHFFGDRSDASTLAAGADCLLLGSYNIECFPYAVLEAMAGGVPVVATATGGLAELVDHRVTGLLVPPRHTQALAMAVLEVLSSPSYASELGAHGKRRLHEVFPFDRWVSEINALYAAVVEQQTGRTAARGRPSSAGRS